MKTKSKKSLVMWMKQFHFLDILGVVLFGGIVGFAAIFFLRTEKTVQVVLNVSESGSLTLSLKPPLWYLENLKPGLSDTDWLGRKTISVEKVDTFYTNQTDRLFYVTLSLQAAYNNRLHQYSFNGVPLLVGGYQTFKLHGVQITGVIQEIGQNLQQSSTSDFLVTGFLDPANDPTYISANSISDGIQPYLANRFQVGQQMKDSSGQVIAEILDVQRSAATRQFIYQDHLVKAIDPDKVRVELKLRIKGRRMSNLYFFLNEQPLVINAVLPLDFNTFGAGLRVTDIGPAH